MKYGMPPRIPSSLKWLIDKRARLDAEIQRTKASLATAKALIEELSKLETDLAAIDRSLRLHEIQVDTDNIRPVRSHYIRIKLPHGELTRSILLCLRKRRGEPVSKSEIAAYIEARHFDLTLSQGTRRLLLSSIHNRCKNLCRDGILKRHHSPDTGEEGLWSLAVSDEEN